MSAELDQFIDQLISQLPSQSNRLEQIRDTKKRRLWHQLTEHVVQYLNEPEVMKVEHFVQFYETVLRDIATKLNPLTHAHIAIQTMKQIKEPALRLDFLQTLPGFSNLSDDSEAKILLSSTIAELKLATGNIEESTSDLDKIESLLDNIHTSDSTVYASFYKAKSKLLKVKGRIVDFYKTGLQYLSYAQMETVDKEERAELAYDLAISALVGDEIFNFGDLLEKQILEALEGTPNQWLAMIIDCFNAGDFTRWQSLQNEYSQKLNSVPELVNNSQILQQKISILALMEYAFNQSGKDLSIPFEKIAEVSRVPLKDVEFLLMKSISIGLLRGKIDQVLQHIVVEWVQPRVLSDDQVLAMRDRLDTWKQNVQKALDMVENQLTPELLS